MERETERDIEIKRPEETNATEGRRGDPEDTSLPPLDQSEEDVPENERG